MKKALFTNCSLCLFSYFKFYCVFTFSNNFSQILVHNITIFFFNRYLGRKMMNELWHYTDWVFFERSLKFLFLKLYYKSPKYAKQTFSNSLPLFVLVLEGTKLSVFVQVCLFVRLSVCTSVCLYVCLFVRLSVCCSSVYSYLNAQL